MIEALQEIVGVCAQRDRGELGARGALLRIGRIARKALDEATPTEVPGDGQPTMANALAGTTFEHRRKRSILGPPERGRWVVNVLPHAGDKLDYIVDDYVGEGIRPRRPHEAVLDTQGMIVDAQTGRLDEQVRELVLYVADYVRRLS